MNFKSFMEAAKALNLWLDDVRDPTDPAIQKAFGAKGWEVWVKTVPEAIKYLEGGDVESISLDHDLGEAQQSGYDLAKWIEEKAFHGTIPKLMWRVHSSNPSGARVITQAMEAADRFWDQPNV